MKKTKLKLGGKANGKAFEDPTVVVLDQKHFYLKLKGNEIKLSKPEIRDLMLTLFDVMQGQEIKLTREDREDLIEKLM